MLYQGHSPRIGDQAWIAPSADVIGQVEIGAQASVWFHCVLRGDVGKIFIGERSNIQDLSVLHVTGGQFDTWVGSEVTVGHRVILHGCHIEDRCLIGMGAVVLDGARIGSESIIGAGSLLTPGTRIPPRVLAFGSPCRVQRELSPDEIAGLKLSAEHYVELARSYSKSDLETSCRT